MSETKLSDSSDAIAVIGMGGRFPGAGNLDQFWLNLRGGVEGVTFFTDEELSALGLTPGILNHPQYVKASAVLDDVEFFDAAFFGFNPREAEIMDPQQRIFLESAWEALETAGYDPETYDGLIGLYAGTSNSSYMFNLYNNSDFFNLVGGFQIGLGNDKDHLATRVAYKLNLKGPALTVQTACSTSLVAIGLACQSLLDYHCDLALAGGVSVRVPQREGYFYQEGGIVSPDGHCRAFDAAAEGCVPGSGVGVVVLKRLSDAIADGDQIEAVVKGFALNNDGSLKVGYTAPSVEGQAEVITLAQADAGVEARSISYIEAHGTATALGDPIEIAALSKAFRADTDEKGFCAIGSVKTNIGHVDAAAGVAGFIKTVLALKHRELPPSLHYRQPNPKIDFENSPFYVNASLCEWKSSGSPRRAGVSSFGIGGTNAHVILEEAPPGESDETSRPHQLLLLSAKTAAALEAATVNLATHLEAHPEQNLADIAYTTHVGRKRFSHRRVLICRTTQDAALALNSPDRKRVHKRTQESSDSPVIFMFPGQGAQYLGMARGLYETEAVFQEHFDNCAEIIKPLVGFDLARVLYESDPGSPESQRELEQTLNAQLALFAVEYALSQLWMNWGVSPKAMIGHSLGEYVAATLAGVFTLEDALTLVAARGRLMQSLPAGTMISVPLSEQKLKPLLDAQLALAAVNAPARCVVSGPVNLIEELEAKLLEEGTPGQRLRTSHAFHSQMMEPILGVFVEQFRKIRLKTPQLPFISNLTGTWITQAQATDPNYWAQHLRQTVRFGEGLQEALKDSGAIFLEVGPGRTLSTFVRQSTDAGVERLAFSSLRRADEREDDSEFLLNTLGKLWLAGATIDWTAYHAHERRHRQALPTYPFERQRYWIEPQQHPLQTHAPATPARKADASEWFYVPSWKQSLAPEPVDASVLSERWLIFLDECGVGLELGTRLKELGQDVSTVAPSERFAKVDEQQYLLRPGVSEDYRSLLEDLQLSGRVPDRVVHLSSVTRSTTTAPHLSPELFEAAQERGFLSLLFLAQALGGLGWTQPLTIDVVSNELQKVTGTEALSPEKATLLGICKVIPHEYANVACRSVDIDLPERGSRQEGRLIDQLVTELCFPPTERMIAYRNGERWVQSFAPARLNGRSNSKAALLRPGGVYLVTGGLGGVGFELAKLLAKSVPSAKLVLVGRSVTPYGEEGPQRVSSSESPNGVPPLRHDPHVKSTSGRIAFNLTEEAERFEKLEARVERELNIKTLRNYEGFEETFNDLCASHLFHYLLNKGVDTRKSYDARALKIELGILPAFEKFYHFILETLSEDGIIELRAQQIIFLKNKNEVIPPDVLEAEISEKYPQFKGLLRLLSHNARHLDQALSEEGGATSVLFPEGNYHFLEEGFRDTVEFSTTRIHTTMLSEIISQALAKSAGKKLRILEVGAGNGILTRAVLPKLLGQNVEYHFTDIGRKFVIQAEKESLNHGLNFMKFNVLDISRDPSEQGFEASSFDLVLGLNVVHATPSINETVANLKRLLSAGGLLCLVEAIRPYRWDNMITGLAEGWWYFADEDLRTNSPLLSAEKWEQALNRHAFESVLTFPRDHATRARRDSGLILAQSESSGAIRYAESSLADNAVGSTVESGDDALRKIYELEELGAEVLACRADVSEAEQLRTVLDGSRARFGPVNGVIHAAAVGIGGVIQLETPEMIRSEFAPKIMGTLQLENLLADEELDFFVLCSSILSVTGGYGQVGYCAANSFLDSYALYSSSKRDRFTTSINWDRWQSVGMAVVAEELKKRITGEELTGGITPEEGAEAFRRILSRAATPQVVVSAKDFLSFMDHHTRPITERLDEFNSTGTAQPLHLRPELENAYLAPRNEAEQKLATIWQELLGIEQVGVEDNFFSLGGDSILSLQMVTKASQAGLRLTPKQIFEHQTIAQLAAVVSSASAISAPEQAPVTGEVTLTPIQRWFFEREFTNPHHWNMPLLLEVPPTIDAEILRRALKHLVVHHDALRMRFRHTDDGWRQFNSPPASDDETSSLVSIDLSHLPDEALASAVTEHCADWQQRLNLADGPLFLALHFNYGSERAGRLLLLAHHLIIDGVSWRIVLEDLEQSYLALSRGKEPKLPQKTTSFKSWAAHLESYAQSSQLQSELSFWRAQESQEVAALPVDHPAGSKTEATTAEFILRLSQGETTQLLKEVPGVYRTQINEVLLAALMRAYRRWSGESRLVIEMEGHGREQITVENAELDLSRTVGWFTSLFPVVLKLGAAEADAGEALKSIKEQMRRIPGNGMGYGVLKYLSREAEVREGLRRRAELSFTYQGETDQTIEASDLFRGAHESSGASHSPEAKRTHELGISAVVAGGELQIRWSYSRERYGEETVRQVAESYVKELRELIRHCLRDDAGGFTPSDFPEAELSQKELDDLITEFGGSY